MKTILMNRAAFGRALANVFRGGQPEDEQRKAMFAKMGRGGGGGGGGGRGGMSGGGGGGGGGNEAEPKKMAYYHKEKQRKADEKKKAEQAVKAASQSKVSIPEPCKYSKVSTTSAGTSVPVVALPFGQGDERLDNNPNFNPSLYAPMRSNGSVKAPPNDGRGYKYDVFTQSWVPGPGQVSTGGMFGRDPITWSPSSRQPLIGSDPITWSPTGKTKQPTYTTKDYSGNKQLQKTIDLYKKQPAGGKMLAVRK